MPSLSLEPEPSKLATLCATLEVNAATGGTFAGGAATVTAWVEAVEAVPELSLTVSVIV